MPKKYNILTFADVPIPSYQRPYRGVLFVDYAPIERLREVFVVSPKSREKFKNNHIRVHARYFSAEDFKKNQYKITYRIGSLFKIFVRLIQFRRVDSKKIDFIRTGGSYLSFLLFLTQKKNIPYFADFCDFYFELYKEFKMPFSRVVTPIIFFVERFIMRRTDLLFVDTSAQRDFLVKKMGVKRKQCVVAPNGIILENFPYLQKKDEDVLREYGFNKDDIVLFYGGDISEMDGVEMIIDFVVDHEELPLKALIIGKGNKKYVENIQAKIHRLHLDDRITLDTFKPYEDVYRYISVADICLAPFHISTTSNTVECGKIITYLLGGKQVLSTRADGVQSLYKDHINYFEDNNYQEFSESILNMIACPLTTTQKDSLRTLGEKFEFRKIIEYEYFLIDKYFQNPRQDFSRFDYL